VRDYTNAVSSRGASLAGPRTAGYHVLTLAGGRQSAPIPYNPGWFDKARRRSSVANEWQMPRAGRACAGCGRTFDANETFRALLYEARGTYERRDYCLNCPPPEQPVPVGTWQTRRPAPTGKKAQAFDREAIYSFFQRLEDADTPEQVQFRFVLALLLWRKRVLKFTATLETNTGECWEFQAPVAGETHRVRRPALAEDQLERLSTRLEQLLSGRAGELDTAAAATAEGQADE
jgi:hypothetical protein